MNHSIEQRFVNVSRSKTFKNIHTAFSLGKKAVLDLGCSNGEFLVHFGPGSVGFTILKEEVEEGRRRGLDVRLFNIEEQAFVPERKFDVIFANNIFEHMQSPHHFLMKLKDFLKEDGILILGVPCIPYVTPLIHLKKFRGALASLHINFFTRSTLIKTAEFAGWRVLAARGFRLRYAFLDYLLNLVYPHFYIVAKADSAFCYAPKRLKELQGYNS